MHVFRRWDSVYQKNSEETTGMFDNSFNYTAYFPIISAVFIVLRQQKQESMCII